MLFCWALVIGALFNCAQCDLKENNASVIIIGAGASGIAAATKLQEFGFINVLVIEAEERIGGRVYSADFGEAVVDLGAEYCHGQKGNIVFELANKLGMLASHEPAYVLYQSIDGQEISIDVHESLFQLAHNVSHRKQFNASKSDMCAGLISVGRCLQKQFDNLMDCSVSHHQDLLKSSYPWLRSYKSATESCLDLDDVSLVSEYEECAGDQMLNWRGRGFKMIFYIMTHQQPKEKKPSIDVAVLLNEKVASIDNWHNGSEINVNLDSGQIHSAQHVIFTPSLGVLKSSHDKLFHPSLPQEKIFAINHIGYGDIVKIALYFEDSWWTANNDRMFGCVWSPQHQAQQEKENLTWTKHFTGFTPVPENPKALMAWFAGEACPDIELLTDHDIMNGIRFILAKCFVTYSHLTMPKKFIRSKWWHEPNFRGTYSYDSVKGFQTGDRRIREKLASPILNEMRVPSLLFAGEATHRTMFATVHGAIETGYREAQRLIDFYNNVGI